MTEDESGALPAPFFPAPTREGALPADKPGTATSTSRPRSGGGRSRRFDPRRKERIVDAALVVMAEKGIAGTTLRRVAERANVPLGSVTYHFAGTNDLLALAFRKFVVEQLKRLETRLLGASNAQDAWFRILEMINEDSANPVHNVSLAKEFQAMAAREPEFRALAQEWIEESTLILERHFDTDTAKILEVFVEGLTFRGRITSVGVHELLSREALQRLSQPGR